MINNVVVSYSVKPECVDEHIRLISAIFDQLAADSPATSYQVMQLDDGVSFVHLASADTPDGSNPLTELAAFKAFVADLGSRTATPPAPSGATTIGKYPPA